MEKEKLKQEFSEMKTFLNGVFVDQNKKYIKRKRKLEMQDVFHFMCHKHGANLSYDECNFDISKQLNNSKVLATNSSYYKKLKNWLLEDISSIKNELNKYIRKKHYKNIKRILSCDGSDLNLVKFIEENEIKYTSSKSTKYKKGYISAIIDVELKSVISCMMSESTDERKLFLSQIDLLEEGDFVIFDAGYYSTNLVEKLNAKKIGFMFRLPVSNNFSKNLKSSINKDQIQQLKISKTNVINVRTIFYQLTKSNELCKKRNTKNLDNVEDYYILTSLTDLNEHTFDEIKNLYHKRWDVETFFRQLKYIASFSRVNYKSIDMVHKALEFTSFLFSFVGYFENVLMKIFKVSQLKKINKKISLKEMSLDLLHTLLKKRLTKSKLTILFNLLNLITKFLMPIQSDRHYRRETKRPINSWSNMGSIFK